jgi:hypothetical protein
MAWKITGTQQKWNEKNIHEKNYILTWFSLGVLMAISQISKHIGAFYKYIYLIGVIGIVLFLLYLLLLPFLVKSFSDKIPLAGLLKNDDQWKRIRNSISMDSVFIMTIFMVPTFLLKESPLWVSSIFVVLWLALFLHGSIHNDRVVIERKPKEPFIQNPITILKIFISVLIIVMVMMGYMIHQTWYK